MSSLSWSHEVLILKFSRKRELFNALVTTYFFGLFKFDSAYYKCIVFFHLQHIMLHFTSAFILSAHAFTVN